MNYYIKRVKTSWTYSRVCGRDNVRAHLGSNIAGEADIVHNITSEATLVLPYYPRGALHTELERRAKTDNHIQVYSYQLINDIELLFKSE